jgi:hypothetical protein
LHGNVDICKILVVAATMKDVLNTGKRIDFADNSFVELAHVFNGLDRSVFLWKNESGETPFSFPASFKDAN